jgi:hypothetical protein
MPTPSKQISSCQALCLSRPRRYFFQTPKHWIYFNPLNDICVFAVPPNIAKSLLRAGADAVAAVDVVAVVVSAAGAVGAFVVVCVAVVAVSDVAAVAVGAVAAAAAAGVTTCSWVTAIVGAASASTRVRNSLRNCRTSNN